MKKIYVLLLLGCFVLDTKAKRLPQLLLTNWQTLNDEQGRFICSFPEGFDYATEDDVLWYSIQTDSVTVEIHHTWPVNSLTPKSSPNSNIDPVAQALNSFTYLVHATDGQIINQSTVYTNAKMGREIELTYYKTEDLLTLRRLFIRVYWDSARMHVFSLEAATTYDSTLSVYRDLLFNSIQFY